MRGPLRRILSELRMQNNIPLDTSLSVRDSEISDAVKTTNKERRKVLQDICMRSLIDIESKH